MPCVWDRFHFRTSGGLTTAQPRLRTPPLGSLPPKIGLPKAISPQKNCGETLIGRSAELKKKPGVGVWVVLRRWGGLWEGKRSVDTERGNSSQTAGSKWKEPKLVVHTKKNMQPVA